jgi:4-amino-4-deoxychorismate lyase
MSARVLFNGAEGADLALHRGLQYGDGVFRTCFIYNSELIDINKQIDTLMSDAARLHLAPLPVGALRDDAARLARDQGRAVLKMLLLRAGSGRGYRSEGAGTDRLLCRYPAPSWPPAAWDRGVTVFRSQFRLATQPALAGIKHLNRLEQVLASRQWEEGAEEALLSDEAGRPVCGTRTNLFWVRDGQLRTPALQRCGVAGMMRAKVLALAPAAIVGDADWAEVESADEVFITNSLIGIWPVARLGARRWAGPGPVTRDLVSRLGHPRLEAA